MRNISSTRRSAFAQMRQLISVVLILALCLAPATVARADFTIRLRADPEEGGTVTGGGTYPNGTNVDILATPAEGYTFIGWYRYGDTEPFSTSPSYTYEQESNRIYVARFEKAVSLQVVADPAQGGTVTQSGDGNYIFDESVTLTATPNPDYLFVGWFDASSTAEPISTEATYTYNIHDSQSIIAKFAPEYSLHVNVSPENGGTVAGTGQVIGGSVVTLEAIPNDTYRFTGWVNASDPNTVLSTDAQYSFNLDSDLILTATFARSYGYIWTWVAIIGGCAAVGLFIAWYILRGRREHRVSTEPAVRQSKGPRYRWKFNFQNIKDRLMEFFRRH